MIVDTPSLFRPIWPESLQPISQWRAQLQAYNEWAAEQFFVAEIDTLVHDRAGFFDDLLRNLWTILELEQEPLTLMAVGGYGRAVLHPGSDIDLLILFESKLSLEQEEKLSAFITHLWDLKIDIGHAVRTVPDCMLQAAADITIATSLIESRIVAGKQSLSEALHGSVMTQFPWQSRDFYQAKSDEQTKRHQNFHGTSYNLEPNIKGSPGGLRDIQTIHWIAKQHFKTRKDESLVEYNYITADEFVELRECQNFLWRIRYALHLTAGKCEDRLLFDYQPEVARWLGYGNAGKAAVEKMMKDYFQVVLKVSELNRMLLQFFEQAILGPTDLQQPEVISEQFARTGNLIMASADDVFENPVNIMRFFITIAADKRIKGIHSHTIRLLRNARSQQEKPLCEIAECRELFCQLVATPKGFGRAFTLMHRHGIIACYLPAWAQIVGQMQFDLFHAYTVDEHTFRLVRNLYRFTLPARSEQFPLCSELVQNFKTPELLFLAGIFHDIAKGRGGDHSELGAADAREFCAQHGYNTEDTELVAWLVEQHLLMSMTAQKRDIYDPDVIREFAQKVKTKRRLQHLYCLTVADIRATNANLWNNWKATLLEELYRATEATLGNDGESKTTLRERVQENKQNALALLLSAGFNVEDIQHLWSRFTADYFSRHTPEQIAWHSQHLTNVKDRQLPLILIGDENNQGTTEIFIYHVEENHLFANVTAVLDAEHLSIHDAQILNTRDGFVMDTFIVLEQDGSPLESLDRIAEVQQHLQDVLRKRSNPPIHHRPLSRRMKNFTVKTKVNFLSHKGQRRTHFELVTLDRPGLIARLARVFQAQSVIVMAAKITTVGEQAEDFFMVTNSNYEALNENEQHDLRQAIIQELDS
ncbi:MULTISPECIES: [protein-PII] uridylyltransferase [Gammaproteobacteria]|uniref:[protein-PII] uridylyltransferase n=1 Tax=Gammaproteobacteria TaxID=1236 RepID=UPI000DD0C0B5|nr:MULTISPECIES: [protein-PII] uridylyltransferase [Gammaproteobacteria]RTE86991.1 [protein-PII] uridylyltransferase [Aliidiomarina sp. B3213]TCZ93219.1 [protein-PII] uridylyltransferase [Lysobacter sp. N42]